MNVILMRRARQFDEALLQNHLQTLQRAHGDLLVLSGRSACYAPVLALAGGLDIQTLVFEQEFYDPQQVHGARKMEWLFEPYAGRDANQSLNTLYHAFAIELEAILRRHSERTLVIYLDQLLLEIVYAVLAGLPLQALQRFSLYLEELSIAILARVPFMGGFQTLLLKSNVTPAQAFVGRPELKLVR
ncbi:hypothetical protein [Pseudomonas fragi]|jgi:hypothetical protein|uniref:Uncharacterized protein n=1 Tax=Pseudomonas fragi TaxID=296 RepID=A0A9Q5B486_PSEFR|nr:hypothetical protein [Pseudomonas fragi]MBM1199703.1 hypothetical protein [Pseudomonas fragi]NNB27077.1 hypothetical protein [Pseudomonas fragi]NNB35793.1 hypothetical protein [Pseudomonas fragi]NNB52090.1 hypothetical protein [Pseudomonas fragi]PAA06729.1 hypothetical protein CJU78_16220 [Pseudomonas fragi]